VPGPRRAFPPPEARHAPGRHQHPHCPATPAAPAACMHSSQACSPAWAAVGRRAHHCTCAAQDAREAGAHVDASLGSGHPALLQKTLQAVVRCHVPWSLLVRPRPGPSCGARMRGAAPLAAIAACHARRRPHARVYIASRRCSRSVCAAGREGFVPVQAAGRRLVPTSGRALACAGCFGAAPRARRARQGPAAARPAGRGGRAEAHAGCRRRVGSRNHSSCCTTGAPRARAHASELCWLHGLSCSCLPSKAKTASARAAGAAV